MRQIRKTWLSPLWAGTNGIGQRPPFVSKVKILILYVMQTHKVKDVAAHLSFAPLYSSPCQNPATTILMPKAVRQ